MMAYHMAKSKTDILKLSPATQLVQVGRQYSEHGFVNPAVYHGSTVLFDDVDSLLDHHRDGWRYGRRGTPTSRAVESAIATLEGGYDCKVCPSGLSAISTTLLAFLKPGDHLLMTDTVYAPARHFCDTVLKGLGVETSYYDPLLGAAIGNLMRTETKLVYCESPGSQTMEIQDISTIVKAAHAAGALAVVDNTWGAGHYFKAFQHGCDISLQAATKYLVGHSDAMMGCVTCNEAAWPQFKEVYETLGQFAGPDDMAMTLRGIRTLDVRLERHMRSALIVAEWLRGRPEVETVLYPALTNAPGHELWKRDFTGACGLFSVILKPVANPAVKAMLEGLELFGMGYSWGGFESLCIPFRPHRTATQWTAEGPCLRLHIGLEEPEDLVRDLGAGFYRLNKA